MIFYVFLFWMSTEVNALCWENKSSNGIYVSKSCGDMYWKIRDEKNEIKYWFKWKCMRVSKAVFHEKISMNWGTKTSWVLTLFITHTHTHTPSNLLVAKSCSLIRFEVVGFFLLLLLLEALMEGENPWIFWGFYISFIWLLHFLYPYNTNSIADLIMLVKAGIWCKGFFSLSLQKRMLQKCFHKETN